MNNIQKTLIHKFNLILEKMINTTIKYYGTELDELCKMESMIMQYIADYPEEPISNFLLHIYRNDQYRDCILRGDDDFFIEKEYDEEYSGSVMSYFNKEEYIRKIFQFKKIWKSIDNDTKNFIKKSMYCLVLISEKYIRSL